VCTLDKGFVKRLCNGTFPDVALALFRTGSAFSRGYVNRDMEAWNAAGGASDRVKLFLDEEVIVLMKREAPKNGPSVSGAEGGWEVLRWDGSCVTLGLEELSQKKPPKPRATTVTYRYLSKKMQDALYGEAKIKAAYDARQKECKGATMGAVTAKCEKLDKALGESIVDHVRAGGALPEPDPI
jgi:hypothetical protein